MIKFISTIIFFGIIILNGGEIFVSINYPNGKKYNSIPDIQKSGKTNTIYSNRGMTLEGDLNETNHYYLIHNTACIHKKPTPIQIVHVDYPKRSAAVIKEAYFK